jgi:hypothetical protein
MYIYHLYFLKCLLGDISSLYSSRLVDCFPVDTDGHRLHIYLSCLSLHLHDLLTSFAISADPAIRDDIQDGPPIYRANLLHYFFKTQEAKTQFPDYVLDISRFTVEKIHTTLKALQTDQPKELSKKLTSLLQMICCILHWFINVFQSDLLEIEDQIKALKSHMKSTLPKYRYSEDAILHVDHDDESKTRTRKSKPDPDEIEKQQQILLRVYQYYSYCKEK